MEHLEALKQYLSERCPALEVREHEPMAAHTSFRIGGPVRLMALPKSEEELAWALRGAAEEGVRPYLVGRGTNLLAEDGEMDVFAVQLYSGLDLLTREGDAIRCGSGVLLSRAALFAQQQGLAGLEFAHGIPGSMGGGAVMNAGAYGGELKDVLAETRYLNLDGTPGVLRGEEQGLGYRRSAFQDGTKVITQCLLRLTPDDPEAIRARMEELSRKRKTSQPLEWPSAGSTFKRPAQGYAAALIDQCGLKGLSVGGAQVSEKHAGFVINRGGATCADVLRLTDRIRAAVLERTGIELELEVKRFPG